MESEEQSQAEAPKRRGPVTKVAIGLVIAMGVCVLAFALSDEMTEEMAEGWVGVVIVMALFAAGIVQCGRWVDRLTHTVWQKAKGSSLDAPLHGLRANWKREGFKMNKAMICPHCTARGQVATRQRTKKKGISGAKATGAILTGGISVLATGLSRRDQVTDVRCHRCQNSWEI